MATLPPPAAPASSAVPAQQGASSPRPRAALYLWEHKNDDATRAALERLRAFAQSQGGDVAIRYVERRMDAGRSPRLSQLLASAQQKRFEVVYVETVDALALSPAGVLRFVHQLEAAGVRLVSSTEPWFDIRGAAERWMLQGELRRQRRSAEALKAKQRDGERTGEIRRGYRLAADGTTIEPDEIEQRIVAEAQRLWADGHSFRTIATTLSSWGYRSRARTALTHRQVARIIKRASRPNAAVIGPSAQS